MQTKPLNRDVIKYIAMFTMLLNHISYIFMEPGSVLSEIFLDIGYFTAIVMCYFLVEGFSYTHSKTNMQYDWQYLQHFRNSHIAWLLQETGFCSFAV